MIQILIQRVVKGSKRVQQEVLNVWEFEETDERFCFQVIHALTDQLHDMQVKAEKEGSDET